MKNVNINPDFVWIRFSQPRKISNIFENRASFKDLELVEDYKHESSSQLRDFDSTGDKYKRKTAFSSSGTVKKIFQISSLCVLFFSIFLVVMDFCNPNMRYIDANLRTILNLVRRRPFKGVVVFIIFYTFTTILFVPGSMLTLGAGLVFSQCFGQVVGIAVASLAVWIGSAVGSWISFLIARYLLFDVVQSWVVKYPTMKAVHRAISENGLTIICLLRMSPIVPWGPLNYMMGVTSMPFKLYMLSSLSMIPDTVAFVYFGAIIDSLKLLTDKHADVESEEESSHTELCDWLMTVSGLFTTFVAVVILAVYSSKLLKKSLKEHEVDKELNSTLENNKQPLQDTTLTSSETVGM